MRTNRYTKIGCWNKENIEISCTLQDCILYNGVMILLVCLDSTHYPIMML